MTLITPSNAEFFHSLYNCVAGLHQIRSSNFRSACPPETTYQPSLRGARRLINGYYVHKLENLQSIQFGMLGLLVLTASSWMSKRLSKCILYLSEQLLDGHIWWERMLQKIESIPYGLQIITWIWIQTVLHIKLQCLNQGVQEEDSKSKCTNWYEHWLSLPESVPAGLRFYRNSFGDVANTPNSSKICNL